MQLRTLKRLTFLLPVLFIGAVLLLLMFLDDSISRGWVLLTFVILTIGAIGFTFWVFRLIEHREAEIRRRSEQLSALHEAALFLTEELDLGAVLQRVVDQARILANAKYGALGVLDESGEWIDQFIVSGMTPGQRSLLKSLPHGHGLLGALIKEGRTIRIPDIASDSRSVGFPPHHPAMYSLLGVPIKFKREVLGDLYLTDKLTSFGEVSEFSDQDQLLLEMFASQAAIAIKNAQHYRQSQQLTLLQERERFGMDLHDGVIQSIYAVGLMLEGVQYQPAMGSAEEKTITKSIEGLNDVIRDIRNYILHLRPQYFQGRHLPEGLEELAREIRAHSFLEINIQIEPHDWARLSPERTVEILHIAREALTNIRKHAHASRADVALARQSENLLLTITDNGNGLDESQVLNGEGNGLRNMRERAQALAGGIKFSGGENGGTRVELLIPFS